MKLNSLQDLFLSELQDLLSCEKQLLQIYPKIIKSITHPQLRRAFEEHQLETIQQEQRLTQCLQKMGVPSGPVRSHGMVGLVSAWMELQSAEGHRDVRDAATIACVQRMEHYEIAAYGCAHAFAEVLEQTEAATFLKQSLLEEELFDRKLTKIAESVVNQEAEAHAG